MSEDNKYELNDLVVAALDQKPLDFETAFDNLVVDRIRSAIENKKIEVAQQMYGYEPSDEIEDVDFENDDEFGSTDLDTDNSEE
jgi:hypothetical protein